MIATVPPEDVIGRDNNKIFDTVTTYSDKYLFYYWYDQFKIADNGDTTKLEKSILALHDKITNSDFYKMNIEERIEHCEVKVNKFRTGDHRIDIVLPIEYMSMLNEISAILNTQRSNILRICMFNSLDIDRYNKFNSYTALTIEFQIIMKQINRLNR